MIQNAIGGGEHNNTELGVWEGKGGKKELSIFSFPLQQTSNQGKVLFQGKSKQKGGQRKTLGLQFVFREVTNMTYQTRGEETTDPVLNIRVRNIVPGAA